MTPILLYDPKLFKEPQPEGSRKIPVPGQLWLNIILNSGVSYVKFYLDQIVSHCLPACVETVYYQKQMQYTAGSKDQIKRSDISKHQIILPLCDI